MHIKKDLADPTTDESLHLACMSGIRRQQDAPEWKRLPITCFEDTEILVMPLHPISIGTAYAMVSIYPLIL